jgi:glycosyltransferase involved in cell wall biosynthesis
MKIFHKSTKKTETPLVSVTVLSYNQERYIRECVESILAQTYSPLEIIFSDDGSSDRTAEIIESCLAGYKGNHSVVFLRHSQNLGGKGKENFLAAYRKSSGKFVIQFCGDDVMMPTMVEKMVDAWLAKKVSMVTVNAEYVDKDSRLLGRQFRDPNKTPEISLEAIARNGVNDAVFGAGMGCSREFLEYFDYAGNPLPSHLGASDIMLTFYACLLNGCDVISAPLMKYRFHGQQGSASIALELAESELRKLVLEEKIWAGHLAHAIFMQEMLDHYVAKDPARFGTVKERIRPLLVHQVVIMSTRLVDVRKQLFYKHNIVEIQPSVAESELNDGRPLNPLGTTC